jgi:hypothetical protein
MGMIGLVQAGGGEIDMLICGKKVKDAFTLCRVGIEASRLHEIVDPFHVPFRVSIFVRRHGGALPLPNG